MILKVLVMYLTLFILINHSFYKYANYLLYNDINYKCSYPIILTKHLDIKIQV